MRNGVSCIKRGFMKFTFYGDLLGISSYYRLDSETAYEKLNEFYNTTFGIFKEVCLTQADLKIKMFSDSLLIYGDNLISIIPSIQKLYLALINKGLFLRGAIVENALTFEPRLQLDNFEKNLPQNDTLARAVGLESSNKGARLLIENAVAKKLLMNAKEWLTHEGFISHIHIMPNNREILLKIAPTPNNDTYEYLYFWSEDNSEEWITNKKRDLEEISKMLGNPINTHYKETLELLKRSIQRKNYCR